MVEWRLGASEISRPFGTYPVIGQAPALKRRASFALSLRDGSTGGYQTCVERVWTCRCLVSPRQPVLDQWCGVFGNVNNAGYGRFRVEEIAAKKYVRKELLSKRQAPGANLGAIEM